jgi:hypothetical protein
LASDLDVQFVDAAFETGVNPGQLRFINLDHAGQDDLLVPRVWLFLPILGVGIAGQRYDSHCQEAK